VHHDVRDVRADVDDRLFDLALVEVEALVGRADRAHERERHQVDPHRVEPGGADGLHEQVHHAPLRRHEEHPQHLPVVLLELADRVVVEHRVVDRIGMNSCTWKPSEERSSFSGR
jgi:hypothetical protein